MVYEVGDRSIIVLANDDALYMHFVHAHLNTIMAHIQHWDQIKGSSGQSTY